MINYYSKYFLPIWLEFFNQFSFTCGYLIYNLDVSQKIIIKSSKNCKIIYSGTVYSYFEKHIHSYRKIKNRIVLSTEIIDNDVLLINLGD